MRTLTQLFSVSKPLIAVLQLFQSSPEELNKNALWDLEFLEKAGFDGILIENQGWDTTSARISKPELMATLADVIKKITSATKLPVGVHICPDDYYSSFALADVSGAQFVQLDRVTGNFQNAVSLDEKDLHLVRSHYPKIALWGGIFPSGYYPPPTEGTIPQTVDRVKKWVDGIVIPVVRARTVGMMSSRVREIELVARLSGSTPAISKSRMTLSDQGATPDRLYQFLSFADALITDFVRSRFTQDWIPMEKVLAAPLIQRAKELRELSTSRQP